MVPCWPCVLLSYRLVNAARNEAILVMWVASYLIVPVFRKRFWHVFAVFPACDNPCMAFFDKGEMLAER